MTADTFQRRMDFIVRHKYPVLGLTEAMTRMDEGTLPDCATVITIDDGWLGTYEKLVPVLKRRRFPATLYTRSKAKAEGVLSQGATWADSPKAVAEASDVVFAIVGFPSDVREVMLGEDGAVAGCKEGNLLVDMTTSDPSLAVEIYDAATAKGIYSIDAPVSGGDVGAKNGTLSIMIGGDKEAVDALNPCWEAMGKTIV
ncbi:MAG: NAD(P)-binding domain-containing protein, partial [Gammaproteobacteria bacterium]|nr:NAD(P)-binding domain-containing protein [Gammaproteobacteria bacterium]